MIRQALLPLLLLAGVARADGEIPADLDRVTPILRDGFRCSGIYIPHAERDRKNDRALERACISPAERDALRLYHGFVGCDYEEEQPIDRLKLVCP